MARPEFKSGTLTHGIILLTLFLLVIMTASPALCDVEPQLEAESEEDVQDAAAVEIETYTTVSAQAGYRFVTPDGPVAAAFPYGRLKSGVSGGFSAARLGSDLKLTVDGAFLHEDDYHSELSFDYASLVRFHAESGALWHNLLKDTLAPNTASYDAIDLNPGTTYGVRSATTQADMRIKLGNNPIHLNLGYWQLTRDGYEQLRFSDYHTGGSNSGTSKNTIYSQTNRIDRVTREGNVGLDAHLGWFDMTYGFRIRDFSNGAAENRFQYVNTGSGALIVDTGAQAHDTLPDSRVTAHSFKLFSDMSGGLVGTAAYTLTQRENSHSHSDAQLPSQPKDNIHNMAGDISYTPFKEVSFALKYRHQEIDRENPASVYYPYSQIPATGTVPGVYTSTPGLLLVRPSQDTVKDVFILSSILKPYPKMIYRLEYSAVLESRDNVPDQLAAAGSPYEVHSDSRQTHTGKASFYWRPNIINMKVNASYSYAACDNPAYGSSFSDQHTGKFLLTYTSSGKWGLTGSYIAEYEDAVNTASTAAPGLTPTTIVTPSGAVSFKLPRESRINTANASFWFSPVERLTITTSYSFLDSNTDQLILFTNQSPGSLAGTNYRSTAHVYGIDASYAAAEQIDLSLSFQQILSKARFNVMSASYVTAPSTAPTQTTTYSTDGISELTRLDTTETGVSARADWRITPMLGCTLDYNFRLYNSGNPIYDGSVHTTMFSLKARW